jgi:acetyl-CoA carboxylase biotin carboxyl carrier protein
MDLKDIKAIIDLMRKNSLSEFELEREGFKIKLKRGGAGPVLASEDQIAPLYAAPIPLPGTIPAGSSAANSAPAPVQNHLEIKSPMIGTFYRAPSPESADYVEVGTEVTSHSTGVRNV